MDSQRKKIIHSKPPDIVTITSKKYWVVLTNKSRLYYTKEGQIIMFSRRKDALYFLEDAKELGNLKIEKLDVIITK